MNHVCPECGQRYDRAGYCATDGRPLADTDDPLLGTEIERYRLARMLGEGGMGRVYLAVQPAIGSRVAIKLLSEDCARSPELLDRFFAEAKAVNLIRHEHIVGVIDLARLGDGRPYIVMEFIEGQTLASVVRRSAAPLGGIVQVMTEVLSALSAAHAIGIVHRDLKPDNVLVTVEGHAKVLDFGIAKLAPGLRDLSPRTKTGALLGTPAYMAPEQISGAGHVDARTDIYAAGVVLFEAVTGKQPFAGTTLFDLMRAHLEEQPPRPRELRPDLPEPLEQVILTALAKAPDRRFQSAAAMAQAMSHAAAALPPEQWRPLSTRGGMMTPMVGAPTPHRTPSAAVAPSDTRKPRRLGWIVGALTTAAFAVGATLVVVAKCGGDEPVPPQVASTSAPAPAPAPAVADAPPPPEELPALDAAPAPIAHHARVATPDARPAAPDASGPTIAGGGSAADHGVIIGDNVHIGGNVVIGSDPQPAQKPAHFTKPADYDPKHFDALAYAPKALALARGVFPDAGLARFDVFGVFPDGHADLTLTHDDSSYVFRSPSHSVRPPGLPANLPVEIACYVEVTVKPTEVDVRVRDLDPIDATCKWPLRPIPHCSLAKVWKLAQAEGAALDTIAKIGFLSDGAWFFDNEYDGKGIVKSFPDRCP